MFKHLKLELFYLRKAFFAYKSGFRYIFNKYLLARKILNYQGVFERPTNNNDLSIHVLSCHRDLVMLIWSLFSFYQVMVSLGQLFIHSDGGLQNNDKKILKEFFPYAKIIEPEEFLEEYKSELERYPLLKKFRTEYPRYFLLKKLIDPYFVSPNPCRLIIDSDLLWFQRPVAIENELRYNCQHSLMMALKEPNPVFRVYFKDGTRLNDELALFNSGLVLYHRKNFNLNKLTQYFEKIDINNKYNSHFIEQGGYASCLENLEKLPSDKYVIKNKVDEMTIVKHYTSPRRPFFYLEGLEKIKNP